MQVALSFSTASELAAECRRTGILPVSSEMEGLTADERSEVTTAWIEGMRSVADRAQKAAVQAFAARGWAYRWFTQWKPQNKADEALAAALEEALDVAERHFPRITLRDLDDQASIGIVQSKGFGGAEGIQVKRDPYGTLLLISVHCFTGPANFVAGEGLEFEPGARSHVFHLVYKALPTVETFIGDLAAHPLITKDSNRDRTVRNSLWMGEGWTGPDATRPGLHRPWNSISEQQVMAA